MTAYFDWAAPLYAKGKPMPKKAQDLLDELDAVRDQLEDIASREPRVRPIVTRLDELFAELEDDAADEAKEET